MNNRERAAPKAVGEAPQEGPQKAEKAVGTKWPFVPCLSRNLSRGTNEEKANENNAQSLVPRGTKPWDKSALSKNVPKHHTPFRGWWYGTILGTNAWGGVSE